ncbi:MAG: TonB family protein [Spirochaetaceae bacterium]|jgi:protein TonB|nr:TonB family protein [Spirochaetaceae bacterium]
MKSIVTVRLAVFAVVAALHLALILFFVIRVQGADTSGEEPVPVMKILDVQEEAPPPPPPPPPVPVTDNPAAVETIAENMIETDDVPEDQTLVPPGSLVTPGVPNQGAGGEYLSMGNISVPPVFSEQDIRGNLVYPPIAKRSGIEGTVYLELFIDSRGQVQRVNILRENPPGRGFGEAAAAAFQGLSGKPAESNGRPVGVRYRYPVRFRLIN